MVDNQLFYYTLRLADSAMIIGQQLSKWCGHGPVLEQDIALTNVALDQIGQARNFYQYAAELKGNTTEDLLAFHRDSHEYSNFLLLEQPNGNWGETITRQFLFDTYNFYFFEQLAKSADQQLAAIAQKALKEIAYHAQFSAEWMIRLGDGTEESHNKMQDALNKLWMWTGEMFQADELDIAMLERGIGVDLTLIKSNWDAKVKEILAIATLEKPEDGWMQKGGKKGIHTEHLGYILAEMQFLPRAYPDAIW